MTHIQPEMQILLQKVHKEATKWGDMTGYSLSPCWFILHWDINISQVKNQWAYSQARQTCWQSGSHEKETQAQLRRLHNREDTWSMGRGKWAPGFYVLHLVWEESRPDTRGWGLSVSHWTTWTTDHSHFKTSSLYCERAYNLGRLKLAKSRITLTM